MVLTSDGRTSKKPTSIILSEEIGPTKHSKIVFRLPESEDKMQLSLSVLWSMYREEYCLFVREEGK